MKKIPNANRLLVTLPADLRRRMEVHQQRTGSSLAEIVRRALVQFLAGGGR